ncbi:unnamed protein product, partial [Didymodactylos carnosus]
SQITFSNCNALCLWTKPQKQRPQPTKTTTTTASTNRARRTSTNNTFFALTAAISGPSVTVDGSDYSDGEDNEQHANIDMENVLLYDDSIDSSDGTSPLNNLPPPITTTANNATTNISPSSSSSTQGSTSSRKPEDLTVVLYSSMAGKNNAIALKSKPLSFWSKQGDELTLLKELASKYLTTPGTSVPSESAFSVAGFVGRKERARLTAKNPSYLVFLKDKI